jgi:hypothetical protein
MVWKYVTNTKRGHSAVNIIGFRTPISTTPTMIVTSPIVNSHLSILLHFQMSVRPYRRIYRIYTCCQYRTCQQQLLSLLPKNTDFVYGPTVAVDLGLLNVWVSWSHSDTPQTVGFPWTGHRPVTENSTRQHTTHTTDICPPGIRTHNPSKQAATNPRLRPHGHRYRPILRFYREKNGIKREEGKKGNVTKEIKNQQ